MLQVHRPNIALMLAERYVKFVVVNAKRVPRQEQVIVEDEVPSGREFGHSFDCFLRNPPDRAAGGARGLEENGLEIGGPIDILNA